MTINVGLTEYEKAGLGVSFSAKIFTPNAFADKL